jgi:LysM repeat protein
MAEEEPKNDAAPKGKGSFFKKNKMAIIAAGILLAVVLLYMVSRKGSTSGSTSAAQTAASGAVDPGTGYLYGSPADLAAMGSSGAVSSVPGPAGATGPAGPAGPQGPTGPKGPTGTPGTVKPGNTVTPQPRPKPATRTYKVEAGDTLSGISNKLHLSGGWQSLYNKNKGVIGGNPNMIRPGQTLHY